MKKLKRKQIKWNTLKIRISAEFPPTVMSPEQAVTFSLARAERALQSKLIPIGAPLLVFQQFIQKVGERLGFRQILKNLSEFFFFKYVSKKTIADILRARTFCFVGRAQRSIPSDKWSKSTGTSSSIWRLTIFRKKFILKKHLFKKKILMQPKVYLTWHIKVSVKITIKISRPARSQTTALQGNYPCRFPPPSANWVCPTPTPSSPPLHFIDSPSSTSLLDSPSFLLRS